MCQFKQVREQCQKVKSPISKNINSDALFLCSQIILNYLTHTHTHTHISQHSHTEHTLISIPIQSHNYNSIISIQLAFFQQKHKIGKSEYLLHGYYQVENSKNVKQKI